MLTAFVAALALAPVEAELKITIGKRPKQSRQED